MQTLSKGVKKPGNPDTGDVYYGALEDNCDWSNNHTHDGNDGQLLALTSQTISAGSWVAAPIAGGVYRQLITVPTGFSYDTCTITFKLSSKEQIYPTIERVSGTTYYVYTMDNSIAFIAYYR